MTTSRFNVGVTSVQSAKPTYAYGSQLQQVPIKSGAALALLRANLPVSIPKNAVVTSAKVWINQYDGGWTGSTTLTLLRHLAAYTYKVTWNTKPAATTSGSQTKTSPPSATWWSIDVTDDVQGFIAGTLSNFGWRLATDNSDVHKLRSQNAAASQPYLEVTYTVPSKVPTDLSPAGAAVTTDKPTLTFSTADETVAFEVQIDPASDGTAPEYDTDTDFPGGVPGSAGVLDLTTTTYAGLADGDTTTWRARSNGASGWSDWSPWVEFSRDDIDTVTLTSPITTPADGSPPFEWTFSGTQDSWQATLLDVNGKVLDDSGLVGGTDTSWTPTKGLKNNGDTGTARIRVWDDVDRVATPGQPTYAEDTVAFTVAFDGTVDPLDTLTATQDDYVPGVNLAGTRAGGVPDEVAIFRNSVQIARIPGTDAFTGTAFAWTDWSAPMNVAATYRIAPVVNGAVCSDGPTVTITPACRGYWLVDPATGVKAVLWEADGGSYDQTDIATVHQPITEGTPPLRRRLRRGVYQGSAVGEIFDALGFPADDTIEALDVIFPANDAGTIYQLINGHRNTKVIAGDFLVSPTMQSGPGETLANGSFNYWGQ